MANYYVSNLRGNDSTGTGTASNPWKTIGKALGTSPAITLSGSGDTLYIEPAIYREVFTLALTPSSSSPLAIVGDCDGAGFAAGGYATPATGVVEWRGWSDDQTAIATAACLTINNAPYVTISRLKIIGTTIYQAGCVNVGGTSTNFTASDCIFVSHANGSCVQVALPYSAGVWNTTIQRCDFHFAGVRGLTLQTQLNSTEYPISAVVRNCRLFGRGNAIQVIQSGGSGAALATGITLQNITTFYAGTAITIYLANAVTMTTPIGVYGCVSILCSTGVWANNASQVAENYGAQSSASAYTNVTPGAASLSAACPALDFDDGRLTGLPLRPFGEPSPVSPFAGLMSGGSPPSVDLSGRNRPEGYGSTAATAGALERHDTGAQNVVYPDAGSPACMALVGPSSQERPLLVDATATVVKVKVRWDGNHGDANKPQAVLVAEPQIGVAGQTVTAASTGGSGATPNSYETLTFASFTPTAAGVVMLRMISRAAAGNGVAYFDTITFS